MFYVPLTDSMTLVAGMPGSPVLLITLYGAPDPVTGIHDSLVRQVVDGTPVSRLNN